MLTNWECSFCINDAIKFKCTSMVSHYERVSPDHADKLVMRAADDVKRRKNRQRRVYVLCFIPGVDDL